VIAEARARGLTVAGVLTEDGTSSDGARLQYVQDLESGQRHLLASAQSGGAAPALHRQESRRTTPSGVPSFGWSFDEDGVTFGRLALEACLCGSCHVLVIDQLGPLEIWEGRGWQVAFDLIIRGGYDLALVVVNPRVLGQVQSRLGACEVVAVSEEDRGALPETICAAHLPEV